MGIDTEKKKRDEIKAVEISDSRREKSIHQIPDDLRSLAHAAILLLRAGFAVRFLLAGLLDVGLLGLLGSLLGYLDGSLQWCASRAGGQFAAGCDLLTELPKALDDMGHCLDEVVELVDREGDALFRNERARVSSM